MSAFVVGETTMHACVRAASLFPAFKDRNLTELGREFYQLNAAAITARYEGRHPDLTAYAEAGVLGYRFDSSKATTKPMVMAKALDCLLYQCREGNVPENPVYKLLDKFADLIAGANGRKTKEYHRAPWGD